MLDRPIHIKFHNNQNPLSSFDFIKLENLFDRNNLEHSIYHPQLVEFYMILFIQEGTGVHTIDFLEYPYQKGTILTIRKDQVHQFHPSDTVVGTLLLFTDDFLVSYLEHLEALKSVQLFNEILGIPKIQLKKQGFQEISTLVERIKQEYFKVNDAYSLGIIRSELHILIAKLFRLKANQQPISTHKKYLHEFIHFQDLVEQHAKQYTKVKDYARLMAVSTKTLNNITQTIVHKSAKQFIDDISIKQIKRLLINTKLSIKEIAYHSGFEESTNFYKYFKRQTKSTPEQFRSTFS
ncbi:MAG: AraC family transcriptional regulator [Aureispira sp.]